MVVLSVILGVLLVIGGFSCMFTPVATFLSTGYYFSILLFVYGVAGIVRAFSKKAGIVEIILSILAVIVGIIAMIRPGSVLVFDTMLLYFVAAWYIVQGVLSVINAFVSKKNGYKAWYWGLITGILGIILGAYAYAHPLVAAVTAGIMIGIYLVQAGFNMITFAFVADHVKKGIDEISGNDQ